MWLRVCSRRGGLVAIIPVRQGSKLIPSSSSWTRKVDLNRSRRYFTGEVVSSTIEITSVTSLIQATLQSIHIHTGLPWWATFATSTALVRLGLFPLVRQQLLASRQLAGAMPELNFLYQLLKRRLVGLKPLHIVERLRILSIFVQGVNACLVLHSASVMTVVAYPLTNMAVFVTFVYSLRSMINGDFRSELQDGGFAWFYDLTQQDTSFLLPFVAISISYIALENSFLAGTTGGNQARFLVLVKDIFQTLLLVSIPIVSSLPAGVFFYWIPSSLFGIGQTLLLRNAQFLKLVRIPPIISPPISRR